MCVLFAGPCLVVLVDSAVWIDWLRTRRTNATGRLEALLEEGEAALAPVILQELLQGAASPAALQRLRREFEALPILVPTGVSTYSEAGILYACCRWRGYTPRSPHDCLIARIAIEHATPLLHDDRDFERIAEIESRLRLIRE
jgi:predicted nucleic acid-binding protein